MKAIFWSECSHYWRLALAVALLFLFGLVYFQYASPSAAISLPYSIIWGFGLVISGAFGAWQFYYHKSHGRWIYLLHRPVDTAHIYLVLLASALFMLFITTALPVLIIALYTDLFTEQLVEFRDYIFVASVYFSCVVIYLVFTLTLLAVNKGAILVLATLGILSMSHVGISPITNLMPLFIVIAVLIYLNLRSFKPDLTVPPQQSLEIVLSYFMMSIGLHILLVVFVSVLFNISQLAGSQNNTKNADHYSLFSQASIGSERMNIALDGNQHLQAENLRNQASLANTDRVSLNSFQFPYLNMSPDRSADTVLRDEVRGHEWQFSHKHRVFIGFEQGTGQRVGILTPQNMRLGAFAPEAPQRFDTVPVPVNDSVLMTHTKIYAVNFEYQTISTIYQTEVGEYFIGLPKLTHGFISIPTSQRLLMFNPAMLQIEELAQPVVSIEFPVSYRQIEDLWLYELADGFAVIFSGSHIFGYEQSGTVVSYQAFYGPAEVISQHSVQKHAEPLWYRQLEELISPLTLYISDTTRYAMNPNTIENSAPLEPLSRFKMISVHTHILVMQILSVVITLFISAKLEIKGSQRLTWGVLAALFGITVCLAMFIMYLLPNPKRTLRQVGHLREYTQNRDH